MKSHISLAIAIMAIAVSAGYSVGYVNDAPASAHASEQVAVSSESKTSFNDDLNGAISTQVAMNVRK